MIFRSGLLCFLAGICMGCQMDLGSSNTYPESVTGQLGTVVIFGEFEGELSQGEDVAQLSLLAEDCGQFISGTLTLNTEVIELTGELVGSGVTMEGKRGDIPLTLVGNVTSFEYMEGAWFDEDGAGGAWSAIYEEGSEPEAPCNVAESILED